MTSRLFISYSHGDDELLQKLHKHLAQLIREGAIEAWFDREIAAGARIDDGIEVELESAEIFLACVSPDWIESKYAYEKEFQRALERERERSIVIVPVIFRPCDWLSTPLKQFRALPKDGKPITQFTNQDVAFLEVVNALRELTLKSSMEIEIKGMAPAIPAPLSQADASRYRVRREFDQLDKRDFAQQAFEDIYRFFEASASEIAAIPNIECRLSSRSEDHFSCSIVNRGVSRGFQTVHIRRGGSWGAIDILFGEHNETGTSNGGFTINSDDYQLFLSPLLFSNLDQGKERLSAGEAAKMVWDDLLSRVGIDYA